MRTCNAESQKRSAKGSNFNSRSYYYYYSIGLSQAHIVCISYPLKDLNQDIHILLHLFYIRVWVAGRFDDL